MAPSFVSAGSENLAGIFGLVAALEKFVNPPVFEGSKLKEIRQFIASCIETIDGCEIVSPKLNCLQNTLSFVVRGADSISLLAGLDLEGFCASSGSACSSGSIEPSHVVSAIGRRELANSLVRFSFGRFSTSKEAAAVCVLLPQIIKRAQIGK